MGQTKKTYKKSKGSAIFAAISFALILGIFVCVPAYAQEEEAIPSMDDEEDGMIITPGDEYPVPMLSTWFTNNPQWAPDGPNYGSFDGGSNRVSVAGWDCELILGGEDGKPLFRVENGNTGETYKFILQGLPDDEYTDLRLLAYPESCTENCQVKITFTLKVNIESQRLWVPR